MSDFKQTMASWASGVSVVTAFADNLVYGMTASSFCAVSLQPQLVSVCVQEISPLRELIIRGGVFAVNILAQGQEVLSRAFAQPKRAPASTLPDVATFAATNGCPILQHALAFVACRLYENVVAGDHHIFVGEVQETRVLSHDAPLVYFRQAYRRLE